MIKCSVVKPTIDTSPRPSVQKYILSPCYFTLYSRLMLAHAANYFSALPAHHQPADAVVKFISCFYYHGFRKSYYREIIE